MSKKHNKISSLLGCCMVGLLLCAGQAEAYSYIQSPYENIDYYDLGMKSMEHREFTKAIEYLKRALAKEPENPFIRNNLAVALTSRGTYLYNQRIDLEKAANDYRTAIYYLQYYGKSNNTDTMKENIVIANQNLDSVLKISNIKLDAKNRLKIAKDLRGKGELIPATVEYIYAAKERSCAYESYVALGDIMNTLDDTYNAALYYDKALALDSSNAYLHLKFGRTLNKLGKTDAAVRELDIASNDKITKSDALKLLEVIWKNKTLVDNKDAVAQMNLGAVYQKQGKLGQALMQYQIAQKLDPQNQIIAINKGTLYQQQGEFSEALDIYNAALKKNPNDPMLKCYKASTLAQMGKNDEAIILYQDVLKLNPQNKQAKQEMLNVISGTSNATALNYLAQLSTTMENDADIQYRYAYFLHRNKDYNLALNYYNKSLNLNSNNLDAYLNIASIYKLKNNIDSAVNTLNKAQTLYPNNEKIAQTLKEYTEEASFSLIQKAAKQYEEKDYENSILTYKSIKNPTEDVFLGIGACYQALEQYNDAILYYKKALDLDKSNPTSHYFLGLAYLYNGDFQNAEISLKKAMELDSVNPDISDAFKSLKFAKSEKIMQEGLTLLEADKTKEALSKFNEALEVCSENGYAHYYKGFILDSQNASDKAITEFKKSLELNPELTIAYYSLAVAYDNLNNNTEAKKMFQKFLELHTTDDEYKKYAQQRLLEL